MANFVNIEGHLINPKQLTHIEMVVDFDFSTKPMTTTYKAQAFFSGGRNLNLKRSEKRSEICDFIELTAYKLNEKTKEKSL